MKATMAAPNRADDVQALQHRYDVEGLRLTRTRTGWLLEGNAPCYETKKRVADEMRERFGPTLVVNRLRVVPQGRRQSAQLERAIRAAVAADHRLAGEAVSANVRNGAVTLRGRVSSSVARYAAEAIAWSVRGVTNVDNRLVVSGRQAEERGRSPLPLG